MCEPDKDKPVASPHAETKRLLSDIARLLDVPLDVFLSADKELDGRVEISPAEPNELLTLYRDLSPEMRRELLTYARWLASKGS